MIALTTDFGLADGFAGVLKGVILSLNPAATDCRSSATEFPRRT